MSCFLNSDLVFPTLRMSLTSRQSPSASLAQNPAPAGSGTRSHAAPLGPLIPVLGSLGLCLVVGGPAVCAPLCSHGNCLEFVQWTQV